MGMGWEGVGRGGKGWEGVGMGWEGVALKKCLITVIHN